MDSVRSHICGVANDEIYKDFIGKFNYLLDHQNTEITLSFSTNLDSLPDNEYFSLINYIDLYIKIMGDTGYLYNNLEFL